MRRLLLAGLVLALGPQAGAKTLPAGDFLNLPLDVRSLGMGEASAAVAEGAGEVSSNPAAIDAVRGSDAYFTHGFLIAGIDSDYLSYGLGVGRHHFGASYYAVGYGTLKGYDDAGNPTSDFNPTDRLYGLSYGTTLWGVEAAGALKFIDSTIVNHASAVTYDLGAQYPLGEEWRLGLVGQNLGGSLKYENVGSPLPAKVALAMGWSAQKDWVLTLDLADPLYTPAYVAMGTEYLLPIGGEGKLAFRLGMNTKTPSLGALAGLKAGFGFRFKSLDLDYALDPMGELGQAHHFALGYRFDWPSRRAK